MTPLISWAITTHNEGEYIRTLLNQLIPHCKQTGDEIVILDDYSDDELTKEIIFGALNNTRNEYGEWVIGVSFRRLDGDFAAQKNHLNTMCKGKYIFQIDADETVHDSLLTASHQLVTLNDTTDLFLVPRVNIVNGLTDEDIKRWGWSVNHKGHVMWPDYQHRLYRNSPDIKWQGKVHERIVGYKTMASLPAEEEWSIIHIKDVDRQRKQNNFYNTIGA
jgi:glycosyltransferase involved in cell wall biosynthesis